MKIATPLQHHIFPVCNYSIKAPLMCYYCATTDIGANANLRLIKAISLFLLLPCLS